MNKKWLFLKQFPTKDIYAQYLFIYYIKFRNQIKIFYSFYDIIFLFFIYISIKSQLLLNILVQRNTYHILYFLKWERKLSIHKYCKITSIAVPIQSHTVLRILQLRNHTTMLIKTNTPDLNLIRVPISEWRESPKAPNSPNLNDSGSSGKEKEEEWKSQIIMIRLLTFFIVSEALLLCSFLWLYYSEIYFICEWTMFFDPYTKWYLRKNEYPGSKRSGIPV